jgi:hypothetical protein
MKDEKRLLDAIDNSVQSGVKETSDSNSGFLLTVLSGSGVIAPWWSRQRDVQLRGLLKKSDHLSGAMYNFATKIAAIPLRVIPRDMSIKSHVLLADEYTRYIHDYSDFGAGWEQFISKWVEDYHSQDNGAFIELIADGPKDTPVQGAIYAMAILDSARCTRTSSPEFPVVYTDDTGKKYKLHHTRVSAISQSPSPKEAMHNVGFCAVSRCVMSAQNLLDIALYKQERMGSRPTQGILLTGGGLDPDDIELAMAVNSQGDTESHLSRYSTYTIVGNKNFVDPKLQQIFLNDAPTWFDERESTIIGMAVIAMAFGMDARELFPSMESSASKADAIITHIKQRGKGPGHVLSVIEHTLNTKVLPTFLKASFDYQDDSEDRQRAEISSIRSYTRVRRIQSGVTSQRVERELMLRDGEITQEQFEELELEDGRLDTGVYVDVLFYSDDPDYVMWLGDCNENNYEEKKTDIMKFLVKSRDAERIRKARRAIAAIEYRFEEYDESEYNPDDIPTDAEAEMPDETYQDNDKISTKLPHTIVNATDETSSYIAQGGGR